MYGKLGQLITFHIHTPYFVQLFLILSSHLHIRLQIFLKYILGKWHIPTRVAYPIIAWFIGAQHLECRAFIFLSVRKLVFGQFLKRNEENTSN